MPRTPEEDASKQAAISEAAPVHPHLFRFARVLGLDLRRFDQDLADNVYAPRLREDFMSGVRSGVNGTPTFLINGMRFDGSDELDSLLAAVRSAT